MANLLQNLETFLSEIQSQTEMVESISEDNGTIIIRLNYECFCIYEKAHAFLVFVASLNEMLHLGKLGLPKTGPKKTLYYRIDLGPLHVNRLETFFHKDITQQDVAASIDFLVSQGWTEKMFKEIGVSRSTFFRYHVRQKGIKAVRDKSQIDPLPTNANLSP